MNWDAGIKIGDVNGVEFNTDVVGIEKAGRAVFWIDINVLMVVYKCNKVNRYQIINDSNQYPPASGSEMDFNLLQDSLPHSNVQKFANTALYFSTTDWLCPIFLIQNRQEWVSNQIHRTAARHLDKTGNNRLF